ncbi:MAG: dihydroorotase [Firmicutes bacterium]|nr:dihydroorotase [Bacillota bacterium]
MKSNSKKTFTGAMVYDGGKFRPRDFSIDGGIVASFDKNDDSVEKIDAKGLYIFPGFADVHVHFREPGFSYKETIKTGSMAAARGGYTAVCAMPNLSPVPDDEKSILAEVEIIQRDAKIHVYPYGAITKGQHGKRLADMYGMAPYAVAFSDDGHGVQSDEMMEKAMITAKKLGKVIAAHCEDERYVKGGVINDGLYAKKHGLPGINTISEWGQISRDVGLLDKTGAAYHVCHVSTATSIGVIRREKKEGYDITCETAPHYLLKNEMMLEDDGRFKMNPPIRSEEDRKALIEGILDGTIDMIATDHAPHTKEEKSKGLLGSLMGVSGLEAAFPTLYTGLVRTGIITLERLTELMCTAPRKRFGLPPINLEVGENADFTIIDLDRKFTLHGDDFLSMGKVTVFEGEEVYGKVVYTAVGGRTAYDEGVL